MLDVVHQLAHVAGQTAHAVTSSRCADDVLEQQFRDVPCVLCASTVMIDAGTANVLAVLSFVRITLKLIELIENRVQGQERF